MTLKRVIDLAKAARLQSDVDEYKLGAVIFSKHKIYCFASNTEKSIPLQKQYNRYKSMKCDCWSKHSAHAEMNCIHKLLQQYYDNLPNFRTLSILVYREHADGTLANAKPCKVCEHALRDLGIKNIYYTTDDSLMFERFDVDSRSKIMIM